MIELITSAVRVQRPMERMSPGDSSFFIRPQYFYKQGTNDFRGAGVLPAIFLISKRRKNAGATLLGLSDDVIR
jgi:hypothetical protein